MDWHILRLRPFCKALWEFTFLQGPQVCEPISSFGTRIARLCQSHKFGGASAATRAAINEASVNFNSMRDIRAKSTNLQAT